MGCAFQCDHFQTFLFTLKGIQEAPYAEGALLHKTAWLLLGKWGWGGVGGQGWWLGSLLPHPSTFAVPEVPAMEHSLKTIYTVISANSKL